MGASRVYLPKRLSASPFRKEFRKVRDHAESHGWRVNETTKGYQFLAPPEDVRPGFKGIVNTHHTPSDVRAFKNFLGDLKNEGGLERPDRCERCGPKKKEKGHDVVECLTDQGLYEEGLSDDDVAELHEMAHGEESG